MKRASLDSLSLFNRAAGQNGHRVSRNDKSSLICSLRLKGGFDKYGKYGTLPIYFDSPEISHIFRTWEKGIFAQLLIL